MSSHYSCKHCKRGTLKDALEIVQVVGSQAGALGQVNGFVPFASDDRNSGHGQNIQSWDLDSIYLVMQYLVSRARYISARYHRRPCGFMTVMTGYVLELK